MRVRGGGGVTLGGSRIAPAEARQYARELSCKRQWIGDGAAQGFEALGQT